MGSENFSNIPFDPVTGHRVANLFADSQTESGLTEAVFFPHNQDTFAGKPVGNIFQPQEFTTLSQPGGGWVCGFSNSHHTGQVLLCSNANGQSFSAFGSSALDYEASVLGGHADQKAMGSFAGNLAGLIRSFHDIVPLVL